MQPTELPLHKSVNWEEEINQRTDWLMQEYVDTLKSSLNEIMGIKQYKERRNYISKNFFDKVYSAGHLRMANFYCVAGAMSCLSRVNDETGDLDGFFPDATTTEANAMVSCPGFAAYVKKNYKDCLKEYLYAKNRKMVTKAGDVLEVDKLKPGMLLLQVSSGNTSSGWHAVVYIGDGKVASFNRDGIYNLKTNIKTKVIDIPEIVRIGWRERVKKMQNMQKNVNGNEMASVFTDLYSGREAEFVNKFEKANTKDNLFMYHPIALDERTFNIAAEKEGLEVVNLSSPQEGKKTAMPWMLFSKIAGKNLDKI